ncbi:MAG: secretin N-terminal domain-containing protein [Nitrospiria bacterium]
MNKTWLIGLIVVFFLTSCLPSKEIKMADQKAQEENWDEALDLYKEALRKNPNDLKLQGKMNEVKIKAGRLHFLKGKELLKSRNYGEAFDEFKKAVVIDPGKIEYQTEIIQATRLKESEEHYQSGQKFIKAGHLDEAMEEMEKALALNPENEAAKTDLVKLNVSKEMLKEGVGELSLKSNQPITLKFHNARLKEVFELLSKTAGINILFDKDVRDDNVTIFVKDATFKETLSLILATNSLFMKRISDDTILIIPKTKPKVDQYQDLMIRTFYLSNAKAKEIVNLLRTMLEIRRIHVNDDLNSITLRETPEKVKLAEKIIEANDRKVGEVMLEFEVLEVDRTNLLRYGFTFSQNTISAGVNINNATPNITPGGIVPPVVTPGVVDLRTLKSLDESVFQFILPQLNVDFLKTDSNAKTLANPKIRILDGKTAKINIGDKVPILLSTTTGVASPGIAITPTVATSTEFRDVGIKVSAEPFIHLNNDITIKLNLEVSSLGDLVDLGQGIKQFKFGQRITETFLNLREGETAVIGGLIKDENRNNENKVPGLGDIPLIGFFFSGIEKQKTRTEILLTITPHIVHGLETPSRDLQSFWSGTEESYSTKPLFADFPTVGDVQRESGGGPPVLPPSGTPPLPPVPTVPKAADEVNSPISQDTGSGASVQMAPSSSQVSEGQETNIDLAVNNVKDLSEFDLTLNYDPSILDLKKAAEGVFMKSDGKQTSFVTSVNVPTGTINIHLVRLGDSEGKSGSGTIGTLTFLGKKKGESPVVLKEVRFLNTVKGSIPVQMNSGVIKVQ